MSGIIGLSSSSKTGFDCFNQDFILSIKKNVPFTHFYSILNTKLKMFLEDDWKTGVANFHYLRDGRWEEVRNAKVELIEEKNLLVLRILPC